MTSDVYTNVPLYDREVDDRTLPPSALEMCNTCGRVLIPVLASARENPLGTWIMNGVDASPYRPAHAHTPAC